MWFRHKPKPKPVAKYDARQIANWFVARFRADGRDLAILRLLNLVYIAHGWHLGFTGVPLFNNRVATWRAGPVVADVFASFKAQGDIVTQEYTGGGFAEVPLTAYITGLLNTIYDDYGSLDSDKLAKITHRIDGPWGAVRRISGYYFPIPNSVIQVYYRERVKQLNGGQQYA